MNVDALAISGTFFRSGYAVYVVEIAHQPTAKKYYYLGQTGDAHYLMARSPFYRMSGHFEYGASTQNQVFKGLCKLLDIKDKDDPREKREAVEAFLVESEIRYHVFRLHDFSYQDENEAEHKRRRHSTLVVETALLRRFKEQYGKALLNSKLTSLKREPTETEKVQIDSVIEELKKNGIEI